MAVKQITVHCVEVEDKPGGLHALLDRAAQENVDFQCFVAFSTGQEKGKVYLSAKDPTTCQSCAEKAGITATEAAGFIISNDDKVGAAAENLKPLADAGISGIVGSAMVCCDGQYQLLIVVSAADGAAAAKALGA